MPSNAAALPRLWRPTASRRGRFTRSTVTGFSAPSKTPRRDTRNTSCASSWQRLSRASGFEALRGRGTDDAGEFGLAPEETPKIDDVEAEKGGLPHRDDGGVARIAGEQREFAKEIPRPGTDRLGSHADFEFARGDKIHAIAALAAADDDGPGRIIARPQKLRYIGDGRGADIAEERNLGDEIPGSQKLAPPRFLEIAG